VRESHRAGGEAVDVGGACLRVAAKPAEPVVEVVGDDEEDVGILDLADCRWRSKRFWILDWALPRRGLREGAAWSEGEGGGAEGGGVEELAAVHGEVLKT